MFKCNYAIKSDKSNFYNNLIALERRDFEKIIGDISFSSNSKLECTMHSDCIKMSFTRPFFFFSIKKNISDYELTLDIDQNKSYISGKIRLKTFVLLSLIFITGIFVSFLFIDAEMLDYLFLFLYLALILVYLIREYSLFKKEITRLFTLLDNE